MSRKRYECVPTLNHTTDVSHIQYDRTADDVNKKGRSI